MKTDTYSVVCKYIFNQKSVFFQSMNHLNLSFNYSSSSKRVINNSNQNNNPVQTDMDANKGQIDTNLGCDYL